MSDETTPDDVPAWLRGPGPLLEHYQLTITIDADTYDALNARAVVQGRPIAPLAGELLHAALYRLPAELTALLDAAGYGLARHRDGLTWVATHHDTGQQVEGDASGSTARGALQALRQQRNDLAVALDDTDQKLLTADVRYVEMQTALRTGKAEPPQWATDAAELTRLKREVVRLARDLTRLAEAPTVGDASLS